MRLEERVRDLTKEFLESILLKQDISPLDFVNLHKRELPALEQIRLQDACCILLDLYTKSKDRKREFIEGLISKPANRKIDTSPLLEGIGESSISIVSINRDGDRTIAVLKAMVAGKEITARAVVKRCPEDLEDPIVGVKMVLSKSISKLTDKMLDDAIKSMENNTRKSQAALRHMTKRLQREMLRRE